VDANPEHDRWIADTAARLYGERPNVTKFHSENNYVARLDFASGRESKVLKLAVSDHLLDSVRQEAEALRRLEQVGLPVPTVEFTQENAPDPHRPFFVMPLIAENNLGNGCREREPWAEEFCRRAGNFLAHLHRQPLELMDGLTPQHYAPIRGINWEHWTTQEAWAVCDPDLRTALTEVAERLRARLSVEPRAVVHDSFIADQVITDGDQAFGITDWETFRAGYPERDLGCFLAAQDVWTNGTKQHAAAFLNGFKDGGGDLDAIRQWIDDWQVHYKMTWAAFYLRTDREEGARILLSGVSRLLGVKQAS